MNRIAVIAIVALLLGGCAAAGVKPDYYAVKQEADRLYGEGKLKEAMDKYQLLVEKVPLEADPWFKIGNIHVRLGQPDAAAAAYREALVREPKLGKAWNNLGVIYMRQAVNAYSQLCQHAGTGDQLCQRAQAMIGGLNALLAPAPAEAGATDQQSEPSPAPESIAPPLPPDDGTAAPNAPPATRDLTWLGRQDPASFFIQLSSGFAAEPLLQLADRFDLMGERHHLFSAVNSRGQTYYQLLHGPFDSYAAAEQAVKALPHDLGALAPTIRRSGSLQALRGLTAGDEERS